MHEELRADDPPQVGRYRLVERLGTGGMGHVFLGRSADGRLAAVKVIRPDLAEDSNFRQRLRREIEAARKVTGEFTAGVVDADTEGHVPWLATAYVHGPSLADAVSQNGPLPVDSVLILAAGLAKGLRAIHGAGVVHRNLKPSNVLLAADGPRMIDFGFSRATEASSPTHGGVASSENFTSPEQATGDPVGLASDVFSLGAVLAFAATGRTPFESESAPALPRPGAHDEPDVSELPSQIRALVKRCLARDPAQRPGPDAILADLSAVRPSVTGQAGWLPAAIRESFSPSTLPAAQTADAAAPASEIPEGATLELPVLSAPPEQPSGLVPPAWAAREPRARRRKRRLLWAGVSAGLLAAAAAAVVAFPGGISLMTTARHPTSGSPATAASIAPASPTATPEPARATPTPTPASSRAVAAPRRHASPSAPSPSAASSAPAKAPKAPPTTTSSPTHPVRGSAPPPVRSVTETALSQYQFQVTWSETSASVQGFHVDNGCPAGACGGADAELYTTTGPVSSTNFTVTPGAHDCFRVQAFNRFGASAWSSFACGSTPSLHVDGTQKWVSTGVYMNSGDRLGIKAAGAVYIYPAHPVSPDGSRSCIPSIQFPHMDFPAPHSYCWSLIARVGNGPPFEVGSSGFVRTTSGELYLGVNDNNFTDNSGSWTVNIQRGGQATTPR